MSNVRHIMPEYDLIEHEDNEDCICGPDVECIVTFGGVTAGWIYIHHSLYAHIHAEH